MKKDYFSLKLTCCSRCWRFGLIFSSLTMGFMLMTAIAIAQTGNIQGIAPVISPTNGTAIDGNAYANWTKADTIINGVLQDWSTSGDIFYWGQVYPGPGAGVLDVIQRTPPQLDTIMAPMPYTPGVDKDTVIVYFDALSPGDPTTFTTDAKINQNPNVYTWGKGNVPPKNEIQNAGALFTWGDPSLTGIDGYPGNSDDLWCAFAGDRSAVNGSSYIDFEFLQAPLYMDTTAIKNGFPEGGFTSHGPDNGRTVGDYLVTVEFTGGGPHANVIVNRWTDIGGGNFEYQQVLSSEDDPMNGYPYGSILASVNTEKTYVHFPAFGQIEQVTLGQHHADGSYYKDTTLVLPYYVVNQWCEGAINVSSLFELNENPCFIVSTVFIRTRSSGESDQSQLKDIPGPPIQLNIVADPPVASCPSDPDIQACTSNEAIAEAYETWKAGFSYTGGTDPVTMISGDFPDLPTNPLCEGVDIEYEYIIEDFCGNRDSCSATFTVTAPDALVVNDGGDELDHLSCDYADQAAVDAAFKTWKDKFTVSGGCDAMLPDLSAYVAPDICSGGEVRINFTIEDLCDTLTADGTFKLTAPDALVVNDGGDELDHLSCDYADQAAVDAAFKTWKDKFTVSGGCDAMLPDLSAYVAPDICSGGEVRINFTIEDLCDTLTADGTFKLTAPDALVVNDGGDELDHLSCDYADQAAVDAAFKTWKDKFTVSGGCDAMLPDLSAYVAPDICSGGEVRINFTIEDLCDTLTADGTFKLTAPDALVVNDGGDELDHLSCDYADQAAVDAAFKTWKDKFTVSGGCDAMLPDLSAYVAPDICSGGEVRINFTIEDLCDTLTADGTFKLTAPDPVWASCSPENSSTSSASDACLTGEQLDIEFQAWKDGFSYGGGCEPLTTNWDELMALDWRNFGNMVDGYEVPFTLRVSDICSSDSATCTFTIPPCNPVCNTVYAFSNPEELEPGDAVADVKCFLNEGYSNWGWSNFIEQPEVGDTVYYMPLYAGNPDCSAITEPVGMVTITYTIGGTLTVDYDMHGDYYLTEAHVNVGCEWYAMKKNGSPTVAPGQYIHGDMMDMATSYSVDFADVSGDVWVIVHGVGCYIDGYTPDPMADSDSNNNTIACTASASVSPESESVTTLGLKSTNLKVYPNPFSETVTFEFKTHSNAHATLEISNLLGQKVATLLDGPVEKGVLNRIDYTPVYETPGMLIYRLTINQSVQTGRIIYKK